jgi:hypothetical protein
LPGGEVTPAEGAARIVELLAARGVVSA